MVLSSVSGLDLHDLISGFRVSPGVWVEVFFTSFYLLRHPGFLAARLKTHPWWDTWRTPEKASIRLRMVNSSIFFGRLHAGAFPNLRLQRFFQLNPWILSIVGL